MLLNFFFFFFLKYHFIKSKHNNYSLCTISASFNFPESTHTLPKNICKKITVTQLCFNFMAQHAGLTLIRPSYFSTHLAATDSIWWSFFSSLQHPPSARSQVSHMYSLSKLDYWITRHSESIPVTDTRVWLYDTYNFAIEYPQSVALVRHDCCHSKNRNELRCKWVCDTLYNVFVIAGTPY